MNADEFVIGICEAVYNSSVEELEDVLNEGSSVQENGPIAEARKWYLELSLTERQNLRVIMSEVAHSAVFGFLCVLDGVRAIEDSEEKGELQLAYVKAGKKQLLNGPGKDELHDIFLAATRNTET